MNTVKIAITIPRNLITVIDELSKKEHVSRSRYITNMLSDRILQEREAMLRDAYDRVFSDDHIRQEQLEMSRWFEGTGSDEGQEW